MDTIKQTDQQPQDVPQDIPVEALSNETGPGQQEDKKDELERKVDDINKKKGVL